MSVRKIKLGGNSIRASFSPKSYDEKSNTMDLVWTTGEKVKRSSWFDGPFYEELSLKKSHVRLDRLNSGAPLLNNHGTGMFGGVRDLSDVIGVVERASIKDGEGTATVRFSSREELQGIIRDIKEGIIRNVSVGYRVHKFEELKDKVDDLPVLRAVDWEPMELSFVGIPADAGAQSRSHDPTNDCEIIKQESEGHEMSKKITRSEEPKAPEETPAAEAPVEAAPEVVAEEPAKVVSDKVVAEEKTGRGTTRRRSPKSRR